MKRSDMVEQAKVKKAAMETAGGMLTDEQAAAVPSLYDEWQMGQTYEVGMRRRYLARLYRCQQTHVAQYTPDLTPALWVVTDEAHAGTVEDPIPAARGMEYIYGKHYLDPFFHSPVKGGMGNGGDLFFRIGQSAVQVQHQHFVSHWHVPPFLQSFSFYLPSVRGPPEPNL